MTPKDAEMLESPLPAAPRQTLAMRLAERNRQRTLRAERLAKLRTMGPEVAPEAAREAAPAALETGLETGLEVVMRTDPEPVAAEPFGAEPLAPEPLILEPLVLDPLAAETAVRIVVQQPDAALSPAQPLEALPDGPLGSPASPPASCPDGPLAGALDELLAAAPVGALPDPMQQAAGMILPGPGVARDLEADAALEDFLRALTGGVPEPAPQPAAPGEILHFHRPAERLEPASGLDRLPGVGPGLVWALGRAGLDSLAAIAPLAPEELSDRLGPIGRLVPAERWVATARAAMTVPAAAMATPVS